MRASTALPQITKVAIFPIQNLSSGAVPAAGLRQKLVDTFAAQGIGVLDDEALEAFMSRHRVRYTAGIDASTAAALQQDTGADAVAIASIEFWSEMAPPKVAMFARLVSLTESPTVVWAADAAMSGDDAPGLFERGLILDSNVLLERALGRLETALTRFLKTREGQWAPKTRESKEFQPKAYRRSPTLDLTQPRSVAVVPFFNLSARQNAGEIVALHFIGQLAATNTLQAIDPGATRRQLLDARIIMDGGLSISDAEMVATLIHADFVLAGCVFRYEDYEGPAGNTGVEFSTLLIEKKTRRVVWSSDSYNDGRDTVGAFEHGASKTAHAMATQMARQTTELLAGPHR